MFGSVDVQADVIKAGFLSADFVEFTVTSEVDATKHQHKRKDSDFYALRRILQSLYPYVLIPYLSQINKTKTSDKEVVSKVQEY